MIQYDVDVFGFLNKSSSVIKRFLVSESIGVTLLPPSSRGRTNLQLAPVFGVAFSVTVDRPPEIRLKWNCRTEPMLLSVSGGSVLNIDLTSGVESK